MKQDPRLSKCIQAVLCMLLVFAICLAFANFTISGTVRGQDGIGVGNVKVLIYNGSTTDVVKEVTYTGDDGMYMTDLLPEGQYTVHAEGSAENILKDLSNGDLFNVDFTLPSTSKKPTATPAPEVVGSPRSSQVKFAQASYNLAPVIQINMSWKRASKLEPIAFDSGSTYDPDGYIVAYEWTFGDGSMGEGKTVEHAYKEEGRYTIKLRVIDNSAAERSAYMTAIISNKPPVAVPGNDTNASAGEVVRFNGTGSYDPDGRVVKYEWSFGDGTTAQGASVSHAYARPDKYKAELKVTDDSGANTTAYRMVSVADVLPTAQPAKSGSPQGFVLLVGAAIACLALVIVMRRKG